MVPEETERDGLLIASFELGPALTNAYLVGDPATNTAVAIDPAWDGEVIVEKAERRGWRITDIWLTHAHFDHFGGAAVVADSGKSPIPIALHPADHPLWRMRGGANFFGFDSFDPGPEPTVPLEHGMHLELGEHAFEVRHTPGHTAGHVVFLARQEGLMFCGDLVFRGSVGRTDLPGGDTGSLLRSIRDEVLNLSDEVTLFPGHGPTTTVGHERRWNPFFGEAGWAQGPPP